MGAIGYLRNKIKKLESSTADIAQNFNSTADKEKVSLGTELLSADGWTSDGWTGDFATGFTHTSGNTSVLSFPLPSTGTKKYIVEFDLSAPIGASTFELYCKIGNSAVFDLYKGSITHYILGIQSVSNGNLEFVPASGFTKTISNISVKEVLDTYDAPFVVKDSTDTAAFELRPTISTLENFFIGKNSGKYNYSGDFNVGVGNGALENNSTGFWNTGIGGNVLNKNTVGSRNIAIGYLAMEANISGYKNVAIGTFALCRNTTGNMNVAIAPDSLFYNTTGYKNIAIGMGALYAQTEGYENVAIGDSALSANTTGFDNVAVGVSALSKNQAGCRSTVIGHQAAYGQYGTAGDYSDNTVIGYRAGFKLSSTGTKNNMIGVQAGCEVTTGKGNVLIGYKAGDNVTTGSNNIIIGYDIDADSATGSNQLNIGGLIKGNTATGALSFVGLPTADPHVAGQIWINSNVLTVSAG